MKRLPPEKIQSFILLWFRKNRRDLPWRKTIDPYKIWISEIMLQQTQVNTVIRYYERWMKNFPTLKHLAGAPLSRVLKSWEGLGYYSRARNLHRTAKIVLKQFKGQFPCLAEELRKLPGIGRYTAGAIASIAFNHPEPILDGNVKRVLARIFAVRGAVDRTSGEKKLWEIARSLVVGVGLKPAPTSEKNRHICGDLNQGLMELGALVCLPENPQCEICPVEKLCEAHQLGKETRFPVKSRKEKTEKLRTVAAVLWKNGRVLLERQPLGGRWGGLWTFPHWIAANGQKEKDFVKNRLKKDLGLQVSGLHPRTELKHGFTKYRVRLRVYEGDVALRLLRRPVPPRKWRETPRKDVPHNNVIARARPPKGAAGPLRSVAESARSNLQAWVRPNELARLPLPRPHQRIAELLPSHA